MRLTGSWVARTRADEYATDIEPLESGWFRARPFATPWTQMHHLLRVPIPVATSVPVC
jgi:hypothetical protein